MARARVSRGHVCAKPRQDVSKLGMQDQRSKHVPERRTSLQIGDPTRRYRRSQWQESGHGNLPRRLAFPPPVLHRIEWRPVGHQSGLDDTSGRRNRQPYGDWGQQAQGGSSKNMSFTSWLVGCFAVVSWRFVARGRNGDESPAFKRIGSGWIEEGKQCQKDYVVA